jgi:hypothetical protein
MSFLTTQKPPKKHTSKKSALDEVERAKRGDVKLKTEEEFLAEFEAEDTYKINGSKSGSMILSRCFYIRHWQFLTPNLQIP